ncbi:MAG: PQQ-binding-like beta-propeller repeat protein [Phycisphaerae bacterium]
MRHHVASMIALFLGIAGIPSVLAADEFVPTDNWPQFHGTAARGIGTGKPPMTWDVPAGKNVKWKSAVPGLGHSSPIIWDDKVFLTTAIRSAGESDLRVGLYGDIASVDDNSEHVYKVMCLSRSTGKVEWEHTPYTGVPKIKRHTKASHANCTPATDGRYVVAFFGSEGLYCYDMAGNLQWEKSLGTLDSGYFMVPQAQWEFASSPIIHEDLVIVQCDVQKKSFIAAYDIKTGKKKWRKKRKDVPTWGTPTVYQTDEVTQVIANGYKKMAGYNIKNGKRLWFVSGGGDIPVPTPVAGDGLIYLMSSHGGPRPIFAIRAGARGNLTREENRKEFVAWHRDTGASYMQTPVLYNGYLFTCTDSGVLSCFKADDGELQFKSRVGQGQTGFTPSMIAADGRLFITSEDGDVYVYAATNEEKKLATNAIGEVCMATPAISKGEFFIRTSKHLYCIGE